MSTEHEDRGMEGPLSKWTNVMKGWQYRWFVLDHQTGLLSYYTSKEKMMRGSRRGCVRLRTSSESSVDEDEQGAVIGIDDEDDSTFTITCDQKTFHFQARNADEREQWVRALEETILRHSQPIQFGGPTSTKPIPTVQEFDKKLAEADAYLQILIEQVGQLETRIDKFEDETQNQRHDALRDSAKAMIESIKQAIVLLQLAKYTIRWPSRKVSKRGRPLKTALIDLIRDSTKPKRSLSPSDNQLNPVNGLIQPDVQDLNGDGSVREVNRLAEGLPDRVSLAGSIASVGSAEECLEYHTSGSNLATQATPEGQGSAKVNIPKSRHLSDQQIPALSYSSSDDDDFFDADEYQENMSPTQGALGHADGRMAKRKVEKEIMIDVADSDDEVLDCGEHGSVVTHLLSQVRLGMDLTRVVLPTFILERRSLLEMYADFFAHPELFATVSDLEDPKERMLQGVRWYLSAFHAGRKGAVAKKPYNPILGETFNCSWDLDEASQTTESDGINGSNTVNEDLLQEGPVPWASPDHVTFIAEQVSHHPPISAFYAEHLRNRMSFNAHIWTKSKFLGLSIGVEMVGQACVSDLKHEEEYIATFPNGYGRSILTIPWFEMGGKCNITCAKTGYSCNIVFHTKPFYGGKRNKITAEVQHVSDRRPFLTIQGEWNGVMYCKGPDDTEERIFVDTGAMKINRKKCRPIEKQGEYESRKLWSDVTANLKIKDIEKATDAKHFLEERQRREARERKEDGTSWETKLFHEDGECWIYDKPLQLRLEKQAEKELELTSATSLTSTTNPSGPSGLTSSGVAGCEAANGNTVSNPAENPQQEIQDLLS